MTPVSESAQPVRWRLVLLASAFLLVSTSLALAAGGAFADDGQARWDEIKSSLFGDRQVQDGQDVLALKTPYRAMDAAVVPVDISAKLSGAPDHYIKAVYLVIDMNPSPVAAVIHFPNGHPWQSLSTRVRVNAYTNIRAIAETNDGQLYMATNFVKASGGCSAPSLKDPAAAATQRGKMKLLLPPEFNAGERILAQILIKHPNSSGMQFDQVSRRFIPADFVRTIEVSYQGKTLFTADTDISISEDPSIRFNLVPEAAGVLKVRAIDSKGREYDHSFDVEAAAKG
jgi:sulfur-oxidizing protein SoxY